MSGPERPPWLLAMPDQLRAVLAHLIAAYDGRHDAARDAAP